MPTRKRNDTKNTTKFEIFRYLCYSDSALQKT